MDDESRTTPVLDLHPLAAASGRNGFGDLQGVESIRP
jgi:hypothetical protein